MRPTVVDAFFRAAARHPDRPVFAEGATAADATYADLAAAVDAMAGALQAAGVEPGDRVAIHLPKSPLYVRAILATMRVGAAYVPLDVSQPLTRARVIVEDARPRVLITGPEGAAALGDAAGTVWRADAIDGITNGINGITDGITDGIDGMYSAKTPCTPVPMRADGLASLLYTSGSTGKPKGVMISHGCLSNFIGWAVDEMALVEADVFSCHAGFHFDLSTLDLFACLWVGGSMWIVPEAKAHDPKGLIEGITGHGISVWYSVPSVLNLLLSGDVLNAETAKTMRRVLFAGEVYPIDGLRKLKAVLPDDAGLYNLYGPTETNVCTWYRVDDIAPDRITPVPIGYAIDETTLAVLDERGAPVAEGEIGELVVGGACVTPGYWERTGDRNTANHLEGLHATGDLVSYEGDALVYRGRIDRMIKLNGFRVELGEIEAAILQHPGIDEAAVVPGEHRGATKLVVWCAGEEPPNLLMLKRHVAQYVPRYMIPHLLRTLPELPKNPNGKIDLRALRARWAEENG